MSSADAIENRQLDAFSGAVDKLEARLEPLLGIPRNELTSQISGLENAKLNLATSYSVCSLYYMFLKTRGVAPHGHPIKQELDRVQLYMKKLAQWEKSQVTTATGGGAGSSSSSSSSSSNSSNSSSSSGGGGGGDGSSSSTAAAAVLSAAEPANVRAALESTPAGRMIHGAMHEDALWQGALQGQRNKKQKGAKQGASDKRGTLQKGGSSPKKKRKA